MVSHSQKVVVIGGNHHNTLGVIRSLGKVGIAPLVILTSGDDNSFVLKSKYIQRSWVVKGSEEAIKTLLHELASIDSKSVVIGCHDGISSAIDSNRDILLPYFEIPGTKKTGEITRLMNKKAMGELATQVGLNVPETIILNKNSFTENRNIPYPCITKPVESKSGSKSEIVICNTPEELASFFNGSKYLKDYIVQRYIKKTIEFQLIGCSLDFGNEVIIPGVSVILRQTKSSNTGFLHYTQLDGTFGQTLENTKTFIKKVGYSGLFSVEFLRNNIGKDYFMEMNFRNDGNAIAVTNAGVNLPYIWYLYCIGADYKNEIKTIHDEYVMPEFVELSLFQRGIISRKEWKQDMKKATTFMDYDFEDPAPTDGWKKYNRQRLKNQVFRFVNLIHKNNK